MTLMDSQKTKELLKKLEERISELEASDREDKEEIIVFLEGAKARLEQSINKGK